MVKTAILELTYRCNLRCRHCYLEGISSTEMDIKQWIHVLKELKRRGYKKLIVSGGEALIAESSYEILLHAKLLGFWTCLFTNGTLIQMHKKIFEETAIDKICISLYAGESSAHDDFVQVKGAFNETIRGIQILSEMKKNVQIRMCINDSNIHEINNVLNICNKYHCEFLLEPQIVQKLDSNRIQTVKRITLEQYNNIIQQYQGHNILFAPYFKSCREGCRAANRLIVIDPIGNIYPCTKIRDMIGIVKEEELIFDERKIGNIIEKKSINPEICLSTYITEINNVVK